MSNNELLLQISDLLDVKLQATENRLREEIQQVRADLQGEIHQVRTDLQGEIQQVRTDFEQVKSDLKQVQMTLENDVISRLQNIEECYTSTYDRYRVEAEKVNALEADVNILKKVVREHSEKLKQIG